MRIPQKLLKKINQDYFNINVYADLMILLKSRYKFKLFNDKSKKKRNFFKT